MTKREQVIKRLNTEFGLSIPIDTPIKSHQRAFRDCGAHSWYFRSKDIEICRYGSSYTMTDLLKYSSWCLFEECGNFEILPNINI